MRYDKIKIKGKIWIERVADITTTRHRGTIDEGRLVYSIANASFYFATATEFVVLAGKYDVISSLSIMLMGYSPLPTGWTTNTAKNDQVIILTSDSGDVGDVSSDSWTITGIEEDGSHSHGGYVNASGSYLRVGKSDYQSTIPLYNHLHSIIADGLHTHSFDGTWRPEHAKFMEVVYS